MKKGCFIFIFILFQTQNNVYAEFCSFSKTSSINDLATCILSNIDGKINTSSSSYLQWLAHHLKKIAQDPISYYIDLETYLIDLEKALINKILEKNQKKTISIFKRGELAQQFRRIFIEFLEKRDIQAGFQKFLKESLDKNNICDPIKDLDTCAKEWCVGKDFSDCIGNVYFSVLNSFKNRISVRGIKTAAQKEELNNITQNLDVNPREIQKKLIQWMVNHKEVPESDVDWEPLEQFFEQLFLKEREALKLQHFVEDISKKTKEEKLKSITQLPQNEKEKLVLYIRGLVALFVKALNSKDTSVDNNALNSKDIPVDNNT